MTGQLTQAIQIAQSLSLAEQLELLQALSEIIQQTHSQNTQTQPTEYNTGFSTESLQRSWQQAMAGETLPLSQLWDGDEH
ncbi:hypothetical protein [Spirulina major]|uniref:hypothetical protein n=1 Tax=Spirulina major TaxID=270636 RepID=UPI000932ADD2|nr:hypothetical protein [Spirulina major]